MDGQCEITIAGKSVNLKFNRFAIESAAAIKDNDSLYKNLVSQIWGGIKGHAFAKQTEVPVTFEEVADWVEEEDIKGDPDQQFIKITEAFQSSLFYKSVMAKKLADEKEQRRSEEKKSNTLTI